MKLSKTDKNSNSFEKNGILVFSLSIFGSALNYLFQILSGRILETAQYGELNSLFSIFNIVTVIGTALGFSITKFVAENNKNIGGNIKSIFKTVFICSFPFLIFLSSVMCFLLKFKMMSSLITSVAITLFSISYIFYGTMQGKKNFMGVSVFNLIQPICKITLGTASLYFISKTIDLTQPYNIVFIFMSIASLFAMFYGYRVSCKSGINFGAVPVSDEFFFFFLVSSICLVVFNNIDILIIRQFFDEQTVGLYSSASLFGKIILYIPTALVIMMVPIVAENKSAAKKVFIKTTVYSLLLSLFASIFLYLSKEFIIKLLMGEKYISATEYVLPICIMIIPIVLVTVFVNYLMASGNEIFASASCILSVITMAILVTYMHKDVKEVLYLLATTYIILLIVLSIKILLINFRSKFLKRS